MATLTYTNTNTLYTITIISSSPIVVTTTELEGEVTFESALEMARFFGLKVAEVRKALKG